MDGTDGRAAAYAFRLGGVVVGAQSLRLLQNPRVISRPSDNLPKHSLFDCLPRIRLSNWAGR
jgi:hypothetical protein